MSKANRLAVAIATIRYRSPLGWSPRTITERLAYIYALKDAAEVQVRANAHAEAMKKEVESQNEGIELNYTVQIEKTNVNGVFVLGDEVAGK